ncbi:MAG: putative HNHc nuclease [Ruminococcus sp.]|nr:putative HNHc nuclease [Ruminococcus sp.]
MYEHVFLQGIKEDSSGTTIIIKIPDKQLTEMIMQKHMKTAELRLDDGRTITAEQRKKAYATIRDIADFTGYFPEEQKEHLKYIHMERTGCEHFSLSDCTVDTAREFINTILEFALENGVPLSEKAINRTDDIGRYLYYCIKHKRCCICGQKGEIHHVDTIGMGFDRNHYDDSKNRKICLCRLHHTIAHQRGMDAFEKMYKVYGIVVDD